MTAGPRIARPFWIAAGLSSVALGAAGALLPLLPTTPFLILAAYCLARGSPRLHRRLVEHPRFGPALADWQRHGAISRRARRIALATLCLAIGASFAAGMPGVVIAVQAAVMAGVAGFILTRPLPPGEAPLSGQPPRGRLP